VIVLPGFQRAANDDVTEERRITLFQAGHCEKRAYGEFKLVSAFAKRLFVEQRVIRPAIVIGYGTRDEMPAPIEGKQLELDAASRPAMRRIEHVRRQSRHFRPRSFNNICVGGYSRRSERLISRQCCGGFVHAGFISNCRAHARGACVSFAAGKKTQKNDH
jgi:hypothetical protein